MPRFSKRSLSNLRTCEPVLQALANEAIKHYDFTVICGHRGKEDQQKAKASGASKLSFPNSRHNSWPSLAFDAVPWPLDWKDIAAFKAMQKAIVASWEALDDDVKKGWKLTCGADWKMRDYPHFQVDKC